MALGEYLIRAYTFQTFCPKILNGRRSQDSVPLPTMSGKGGGLGQDLLRFLHLAITFVSIVGVLSRLLRSAF